MDFFQFLSINDESETRHKTPSCHQTSVDTIGFHLRKGLMVKVIYKKNSPLNYYKGYVGEVKQYKPNSEHALVILHAVNYPKLIRMPIDHFVVE